MIDYRDMSTYELLALAPPGWGGVLLQGLLLSMQLAALGFGLGFLIGIGGALGKIKGGPVLRDLLTIYTTCFRAVPELVLILFAYFALPALVNDFLGVFGLPEVQISGFAAGVIVIAAVQGAYATEVVRGAILAIPAGLFDAGKALGLGPLLMFWKITLPLFLPNALPGLSNLWLIATKDTALLAVVGLTELTLAARQAAGATKHHLLFFVAAGALYLMVTYVSVKVFQLLERRCRKDTASV